ncbi:MAG: hypothetical protein ABIK28_11580 [Planctomycetota bacterium]
MAKVNGTIHVYCYHCGHLLKVGQRTKSTSCPACNKSVLVEDIVVKTYVGVTNLETCGKLIVKRRGHAAALHRIVALSGIEVDGQLHCEYALTAGPTFIGKKAEWKGDLQSPSLTVEIGSVITGGYFAVPVDPLEPHRHQEEALEGEAMSP